jgi:hypothetical protein
MKYLIPSLYLLATTSAFATPSFELAGSCLTNVESAIDETKDESSGADGASVYEVLDMNGNTIEVSYGRHLFEGYLHGTASIKISKIKSKVSGDKTILDACNVVDIEILDETGD